MYLHFFSPFETFSIKANALFWAMRFKPQQTLDFFCTSIFDSTTIGF